MIMMRLLGRPAITLLIVLSLGACDTDPPAKPGDVQVTGGSPERAEAAFNRYGCVACHVIPGITGARGRAGPPLENWATRRFIAGEAANRQETLIRFIRDPQSIRPGSGMPELGVPEDDARDMAAYLFTLR